VPHDSDLEPARFSGNMVHECPEGGVQDDKSGRHGGAGDPRPSEATGVPEGASDTTMSRALLGWGLVLSVVAVWCISALGIGVNFAHSFWEWLPIFAFGGGVPALFLWQANRVLAPRRDNRLGPSANNQEKELLQALVECGELTPITAALHTSLTADEAAQMLEILAGSGHLQIRVEDGLQAYALREPDRRGLPGNLRQSAAPPTLDDPLSEWEFEVLALLASGRTNREIARDLFVTVGTVKSHTSNIYGKLGAKNRAEALAKARIARLLK